jgi:glyoxylase-like metal-dependent hydrolase (beta-lactamase superfamily II)
MTTGFRLGDFELTWLNGGKFELDGGAMFGVVPKVLWQKKYPADEQNYIPLIASPILVKAGNKNILIETGLGNKLSDKQKQIFRVREEWGVPADLNRLGLTREDIDIVVLTHFDFDHAGGLIMQNESGTVEPTFPNAKIVLQKSEWDDVLSPNKRSINTFWPVNYAVLKDSSNIQLVDGTEEIAPGLRVIHTGGHNRGHQIVRLQSEGCIAYHMADLLPTHAHFNPLWIMAYDNYPLDAIAQKEEWENKALRENAWFTFYHDPFVLACRFDEKGTMTDQWKGED